jgi:hypothetical protein
VHWQLPFIGNFSDFVHGLKRNNLAKGMGIFNADEGSGRLMKNFFSQSVPERFGS